jgi:hypothetical protein
VWSSGIVSAEETGAMGREIESRQGLGWQVLRKKKYVIRIPQELIFALLKSGQLY